MIKENVQKSINVKNQGSGNGKWTGGKNTYYKNHYQRKLNRRQKLKECGNKCEGCGKSNVILNAHSIDGDKDNHDISNLKMLCAKCLGSKSNSKYKTKYGSTLNELCHEFGVSLTTLYKFIPTCDTKARIKTAATRYVKEKNSKRYVI